MSYGEHKARASMIFYFSALYQKVKEQIAAAEMRSKSDTFIFSRKFQCSENYKI